MYSQLESSLQNMALCHLEWVYVDVYKRQAAYRFYKKLLERMKEEGYDIVDTGCESENEAAWSGFAQCGYCSRCSLLATSDYRLLKKI